MDLVICFLVLYSVGFIMGLCVASHRHCDAVRKWSEQNERLMEMLNHAGDVIIRQNKDLNLVINNGVESDETFIN